MGDELIEHAAAERLRQEAPLARRVAPRTLDDLVGQDHILGKGKILRRAIEADRVTSLILYGPPGCGKTALARIIAMRTKAAFENLNAVTAGVKELREFIAAAKQRRLHQQRRTILFVDEIHRFNRAQQDALLPDVENGNIVLIGATTENPFFSVVAPLLSRSQVFELHGLDDDAIIRLLRRALAHPDRGLPETEVRVDDDALAHIALYSEGDARRALNALEVAMLTTPPEAGVVHLTRAIAEESIQRKMIHYDGIGDEHFDAASAFIKSMRGSDPDSALYWMGYMLEAGENPRFIARRICICASEDVGNADPMALVLATSAWQACEFIGLPEAQIILAHAATYIACAPKSNAAYVGIAKAREDIREGRTVAVPNHLRDAHYKGAARLGRGLGYQYAHDGEDGYVTQDYGAARGAYYRPADRGKEAEFRARLAELARRDALAAAQAAGPASSAEPPAPRADLLIRRAGEGDREGWLAVRRALWPETDDAEHRAEIDEMLARPDRWVTFVLVDRDGAVHGFAEASLREDPAAVSGERVGYLEGWYVAPELRRQGWGGRLVVAVENWSRANGCTSLLSDTDLDNAVSRSAHAALGFSEEDHAVVFRKPLAPDPDRTP